MKNLLTILGLKKRSGQSVAECVIVLPVLILIFWIVVYFGRAVVLKQRTAMAARYHTHKIARDFPKPDAGKIHSLFFYDVGESANIGTNDDTDPVLTLMGMVPMVTTFLTNGQYLPPLTMNLLNPNVREYATVGEVSYEVEPVDALSFVGNRIVKAGLVIDANPWVFPSFNFPYLSTEGMIASYGLQFGWSPWWLPPPFLFGFPQWWMPWPWFYYPPWPGSDS